MSRETDRVNAIGRRIAKYRREREMSAAELAEKAGNGLTRSTIANLENGRKADLTVQQLIAIATALDVSATSLLGSSDRLRAAFAAWEKASANYQTAMKQYTYALLDLAAEADRAESLTDAEARWFNESLNLWTPAGLTLDMPIALEAAIKREKLTEGPRVVALVELLADDAFKLRSDGEYSEAP